MIDMGSIKTNTGAGGQIAEWDKFSGFFTQRDVVDMLRVSGKAGYLPQKILDLGLVTAELVSDPNFAVWKVIRSFKLKCWGGHLNSSDGINVVNRKGGTFLSASAIMNFQDSVEIDLPVDAGIGFRPNGYTSTVAFCYNCTPLDLISNE